MFEIYGGLKKFKQWSKNQKLIMDRLPVGAEVLFYNDPTVDDPLIVEVYEFSDNGGNTVRVCDVPNIFLTETKRIKVRIPNRVSGLYGTLHSITGPHEKYYEVEAAEKPADYIYEETEVEGSADISDEQVETVIIKYLSEEGNRVTDEEVIALLSDT